jgi:transcriptional regulator with XRE-family HTH domain
MVNRIKEILNHYDLTPSKFADILDVPRSTISHILSERNKPSLEFIQKVLDKFPEIETNWLVRGDGVITGNEHNLFSTMESSSKKNISGNDREKEEVNTTNQPELPAENLIITGHKPDGDFHENLSEETNRSGGAERDNNQSIKNENSNNSSKRKITRIIAFYEDDTFEEYFPSKSKP